jgi:hypothetical protein
MSTSESLALPFHGNKLLGVFTWVIVQHWGFLLQ